MSGTKRLNVNLPESTYDSLKKLSERTNRSMTELIRTALGLTSLAYTAKMENDTLAVVEKKDGKYQVKREIVIP